MLTIHVGGASALELQHSEPQVVERINDFFGYPAVARLRLIQAPPVRPVKRAAPAPTRPLAADELAALAAAVAIVGDPELRGALARLGRPSRPSSCPRTDRPPDEAARRRDHGARSSNGRWVIQRWLRRLC